MLRPATALVERSRMVKDAEEIEQIRAAILLGADLFDVILKTTRPGVKESDVAAELEYAARKAGAEAMSFPTIIAAGDRSSLPHGRASGATIPARGFVVCDFGVILAGYCSDMTRTVHVGRPTSEARRIYEAVRQAQRDGWVRRTVENLLLVLATLLPIVNPFGGAPVFLAMTADCTAPLRATLAQKIAVNAFILLLGSLFIGAYVLDFFGLSIPAVPRALCCHGNGHRLCLLAL